MFCTQYKVISLENVINCFCLTVLKLLKCLFFKKIIVVADGQEYVADEKKQKKAFN